MDTFVPPTTREKRPSFEPEERIEVQTFPWGPLHERTTTEPLVPPLRRVSRQIQAAPVLPLRETIAPTTPMPPTVTIPRLDGIAKNRKRIGLGALAVAMVAASIAVFAAAVRPDDDTATSHVETTSAAVSAPRTQQAPLTLTPMPTSTNAFEPVPRLPPVPVPHRRPTPRTASSPPSPLQSSR